MKNKHLIIFNITLHVLAVLSVYVICYVGIGWFRPIGTSPDYEKINNVLINLSYSFITGYVVYLLTSLIPYANRQKKAKSHLRALMNNIYDHRIKITMTATAPIGMYKKDLSDEDIISNFQNADFQQSYSIGLLNTTPLLVSLENQRELIISDINSVIFKYGNDLPFDLLDKLEDILNGNYLKIIAGIRVAIQLNKWDIEEKGIFAKELLVIKSQILDIVSECK